MLSLYIQKNNFIITLKANKCVINNKNMIYTNTLRVKKKIPYRLFLMQFHKREGTGRV